MARFVCPVQYLHGKVWIRYIINGEDKTVVIPPVNFFKADDFMFFVFYEGETARNILRCCVEPLDGAVFRIISIKFEKKFNYINRTILGNGFQSRSLSKSYYSDGKLPRRLKFVSREQRNSDYLINKSRKRDIVSSSFVFMDYAKESIDQHVPHLLGAIDSKEGYTTFIAKPKNALLTIRRDFKDKLVDKRTIVIDILSYVDTEKNVFNRYFNILGINVDKSRANTINVWDSRQEVVSNADAYIMNNLAKIKEIGIDIEAVMIDNQYAKNWGDWLEVREEYTTDMQGLINKIHSQNKKVFIYFNPFVCREGSRLFKEHKEWLVKNEKGTIVCEKDRNTFRKIYIVDIYNEEAKKYVNDIITTMTEKWKVDGIKFGKLYYAAIQPYNDMARATLMERTLKYLREAAKDKICIFDEAPLEVAIFSADYCNISPQCSHDWKGDINIKRGYNEGDSTYRAITDMILRRMYNYRAFVSSSPSIHISTQSNSLTRTQRFLLASVAYFFTGMTVYEDNLCAMSHEELEDMTMFFPKKKAEVEWVIPYINKTFVCRIRVEGKREAYYLFINPTKKVQVTRYDDENLFFSAVDGKVVRPDNGITMQPFEYKLLTKIQEEDILYGITDNIIPKSDVIEVQVEKKTLGGQILKVTLSKKVNRDMDLFVKSDTVTEVYLNNKKCTMVEYNTSCEKYTYHC